MPAWCQVVAALAWAMLAPAAFAAVIYDNLSATGTYAQFQGQGVAGPDTSFGRELRIASPFTPTSDAALGTVELGLSHDDENPSAGLRVRLLADASGLPGVLIEDLGVVSGFPAFTASESFLAVATSSIRPMVLAGVQYWIELSGATDDSIAVWNTNDQDFRGDAFLDGAVGTWQGRPNSPAEAMRITAATVAEPAAIVLLIVGMAGARLTRPRRAPGVAMDDSSRGPRVSGDVDSRGGSASGGIV